MIPRVFHFAAMERRGGTLKRCYKNRHPRLTPQRNSRTLLPGCFAWNGSESESVGSEAAARFPEPEEMLLIAAVDPAILIDSRGDGPVRASAG